MRAGQSSGALPLSAPCAPRLTCRPPKGNHELYLAEVAYQSFGRTAQFWGDKYLTSNVQILNSDTDDWEYIGQTHKYLTTPNGLRIMAFGVLFDFTGKGIPAQGLRPRVDPCLPGNVNVSKVIPAETMVAQDWFLDALNSTEPVDLFLVLGHNPARPSVSLSTFDAVYEAIRRAHPQTPIQFQGRLPRGLGVPRGHC